MGKATTFLRFAFLFFVTSTLFVTVPVVASLLILTLATYLTILGLFVIFVDRDSKRKDKEIERLRKELRKAKQTDREKVEAWKEVYKNSPYSFEKDGEELELEYDFNK